MNIANTLSRIRIGPRIYLGFLAVVAVVVFESALAYRGADDAEQNLDDIEQVRDRAIAILELDRAVVSLQRNIENYTFTGHDSVARRVRTQMEKLWQRLEVVGGLAEDEHERELLGRMKRHFEVYEETFELVVEERELRQRLVREVTGDTRQDFADSMRILREREPDSPHLSALDSAMRTAETNLYRYLHEPQYSLLLDTKRMFDAAVRGFEASGAGAGADIRAVRARLVGSVGQFEQEFTRAVQATRSFLYLVGVVMAGEAQEFRYLSTELRDLVLAEGIPISNEVAEATHDNQQTATLVSIVAILFALLISWLIARSISVPIERMTTTFKDLAAGKNDAVIAEIDRHDEIGVMAKAANVFREKNLETQRLLEQAQELTRRLDEHQKELERSNAEMEQFVYTVSHDLKSPIVTSLGFIGMMRKLASQGKLDKAMSKLDTLEKANRRMSQLIDDLLDLSRVGRVDKDFKHLDMNRLVRDLLASLARKLEESQMTVEIVGELPDIQANESRVLQVFDNLLGNAMKYAGKQPGGSKVEIGGMQTDTETRFFVKDNGPGIPPQFHERVFGLFQRLHPSAPGTGIGLAIVMRVMQFHEGRVWIESSGTGDGTCFWLAFPRETNDHHEHGRHE